MVECKSSGNIIMAVITNGVVQYYTVITGIIIMMYIVRA